VTPAMPLAPEFLLARGKLFVRLGSIASGACESILRMSSMTTLFSKPAATTVPSCDQLMSKIALLFGSTSPALSGCGLGL